MNQPSSVRSRRAFTLIELLTVIAIIGILAAILIPVVGAVRQQARNVQSLSNVRQIGLGQQLYANANKGYFATPQVTNGGASVSAYWVDYLDAYIDTDRPHGQRADVYQDPAALKGSVETPPTYALTHYSMNQAVTNSSRDLVTGVITPFPGSPGVVTRANIQRPSRAILVVTGTQSATNGNADAALWGAIYANIANLDALVPSTSPDMGSSGGIAYRLKGSAGAVMVDGSVLSLKRGTITYANLRAW